MTRPDVQQAGRRADLTGLGRPELAELADHLQPGERVLEVGTPLHAGVFGLLVLTDRRLLFRKVGRQATAVELDLVDVAGVEWKRSFRGRSRLAVQTQDDELVFTELPNEQGAAIESGLRAARTTPRPAAPPSPPVAPAPARQVGGVRLDLQGRRALVTDSAQGIGLAIATGLARAGAAVVLTARGEAGLAAAADRVRAEAEGADVTTVAADISSDAGTATLLAAVPDVDVLVDLGVPGAQPALQTPDDEWRRCSEGDVVTAVRLIRAYLPGMRERGWGRALLVVGAPIATPADLIRYGVATAALLAVSRGFAEEAAGSGVTVNSVIAGPTHTAGVEEFVRSLVGDLPWDQAQREFMRVHRPQSLLQRLVEPEEIANLVVYLASPLASATTGGALRVDGGHGDSMLP